MKKTVAALALFASSNAMAFMMPRDPNAPEPVISKLCLEAGKMSDGSLIGGCDATYNNERAKAPLLENGCAAGQVALSFLGESPIHSCMPPGAAQL